MREAIAVIAVLIVALCILCIADFMRRSDAGTPNVQRFVAECARVGFTPEQCHFFHAGGQSEYDGDSAPP